MSQSPATFKMQPATPRPCYSPMPVAHSSICCCSIHPSIHPIDTLYCQGPRPLKLARKRLQHSPMHSSQCRVFSFIQILTAACAHQHKTISLQPKAKKSHLTWTCSFLLCSPTTPPAIISHSALASSPHFSLVCGIAQGGGTLLFFFSLGN